MSVELLQLQSSDQLIESCTHSDNFEDNDNTNKTQNNNDNTYNWKNAIRKEGERSIDGTGKSMVIWSDGSNYNGEWVNEMCHGSGIMEWIDNITHNKIAVYNGQWQYDEMNGYGVMTDIISGNIHTGYWLNNKRHGIGNLILSNGTEYNGIWRNNIMIR